MSSLPHRTALASSQCHSWNIHVYVWQSCWCSWNTRNPLEATTEHLPMWVQIHTSQYNRKLTCCWNCYFNTYTVILSFTHAASNSSDSQVRTKETEAKAKMKTHADFHRHTTPHTLTPGDTVLHHQPKRNKLTIPYNNKSYTVTKVKGCMVTTTRNGHFTTRNSSFFKKIAPELVDIPPGPDDKDCDHSDASASGHNNTKILLKAQPTSYRLPTGQYIAYGLFNIWTRSQTRIIHVLRHGHKLQLFDLKMDWFTHVWENKWRKKMCWCASSMLLFGLFVHA